MTKVASTSWRTLIALIFLNKVFHVKLEMRALHFRKIACGARKAHASRAPAQTARHLGSSTKTSQILALKKV